MMMKTFVVNKWKWKQVVLLLITWLVACASFAAENTGIILDNKLAQGSDKKATSATLKDIKFSTLAGDRIQIAMIIDGRIKKPTSFTVDEPARIAFDFPDTSNQLNWRTRRVGVGIVKSVAAISSKNKTRVVINLAKLVGYTSRFEGNKFIITLSGAKQISGKDRAKKTPRKANIDNIDFRRGAAGEGRVVVNFDSPDVIVDVRDEQGKIVVDYIGIKLPQRLQQRLDVVDFATPVKTVDTFVDGNNTRMVISADGRYEHLAYQSDRTLTIDVKPIASTELVETRREHYTGEKLSLNFQDIEIRAVLQLLADFTGLNIVVSDTVQGNITLRLKNTPWDQALDIILKTKGLAMRQSGTVVLIAPGEEIAAREKLELEARKQISELAPLQSELVQINYAKASKLAEIIKSEKNSLLSARGNITVDERTNTLLIHDTANRLEQIRKLVSQLDIPIRQVMIESRIVIASDSFSRELGARMGLAGGTQAGGGLLTASGTGRGTTPVNAIGNTTTAIEGGGFTSTAAGGNSGYNINFPVDANSNPATFALSFLTSPALLDLELSALQAEGRGEVISNPRIITANQREAIIEQGEEIPYQQNTSSGATSVSFRKAVMSLKVTPQITPDDRIILDLKVTKDSRSQQAVPGGAGVAIDTKEIQTQVLVNNGETVVLGGIYEHDKSTSISKVPFLGDIPFIGALFRYKKVDNNKDELLIFVTPKIIKDNFKI